MTIKAISVLALVTAMAAASPAQAQIFGGNNGRTLIGAGIGAGLGGALGSNLAGTGVQDEGTAIGAVLGGLAGAHIANAGSSRYGAYGPGYGGYGYNQGGNGGLIGAGLGAVAGGVLGSNLAGTGVQDEGTAIGAVLGGLVGYGLGNQFGGQSGFSGGMTGQPYFGGSYGHSYGTFGGTYMAPPAMPAPQYVHGGYVNAGSYTTPSYTNYVYHPAPQPIVQTHRVVHQQPVIRKTVHVTQPQKIIRKTVHVTQPKYIDVVEHKTLPPVNIEAPKKVIYKPAPKVRVLPKPQSGVYCYAGSSKRYDDYGRLIGGSGCN